MFDTSKKGRSGYIRIVTLTIYHTVELQTVLLKL